MATEDARLNRQVILTGCRSLTASFRTLGLVVSHPFARKKAKGWGTELVQKHTVRDLAD